MAAGEWAACSTKGGGFICSEIFSASFPSAGNTVVRLSLMTVAVPMVLPGQSHDEWAGASREVLGVGRTSTRAKGRTGEGLGGPGNATS